MVTDTVFHGGYVHLQFLSKTLKKMGIDIEIVSYSKKPMEGFKTYTLPSVSFPGIFYKICLSSARFFKLIKNIDADVVHLHHCSGSLELMIEMIKRFVPVIGTMHISAGGRNWIDKIIGMYFNRVLKKHLMSLDKIICVSKFVENGLKNIGLKNTKVIYNGVDLECFFPAGGSRKILGIPESVFMLLYVGRLSPEKGINILLKSFKRLKIPNKKLYIIGSGPLERLCKIYSKINRDIIFLGRVDIQTLRLYYSASDLLVMPSLWSEAFGMVLIESMACKTPVVASCVGAIPEIVDHGKNGFLVKKITPEGFRKEIENAKKYDLQKLGENGMEFVKENFTWDKIASETLKTYKEALS